MKIPHFSHFLYVRGGWEFSRYTRTSLLNCVNYVDCVNTWVPGSSSCVGLVSYEVLTCVNTFFACVGMGPKFGVRQKFSVGSKFGVGYKIYVHQNVYA